MELKPGYNQTEVGVIPEDWDEKTLFELAEAKKDRFDDGDWIEAEYLTETGVRLIQTGNIGEGEFIDKATKKYISETSFHSLHCKEIIPGDILICRLAEPAGRACVLPELGESKAITAVDVTIFRPVENVADRRYLCQVFATRRWLEAVSQHCGGSTRSRISRSELGKIAIGVPKLPEQCAIAGALGDVDALLGGLAQLIAKKRDLKQAAMQQLLTGQTRLPGFNGKWKVKRLVEIGSTFGGLTGKTKSDFGEGSARYITFMNIMTNVVIDPDTFEQVKVSPAESQNEVMKGDLFFNGSSETPEEVGMCAVLFDDVQNVFLNSFCFGFRFREDANTDGLYLAYFFRSSEGRELLKSLAQGATRYNLSKTSLLKLNFPLPSLPEQTAITAVLSDMDAELTALEQRRAKTCALKQGMMQELLTGRTRIV